MKTKKSGNSVLRELRKIRNKHYEETKNMTTEERIKYYRKGAERFDAKLEQYRREKYAKGKK
jgi:hypothetical protein